jgi:hypothetical protein
MRLVVPGDGRDFLGHLEDKDAKQLKPSEEVDGHLAVAS